MPSALENIKSQIELIIKSVPGTGLVYNELILTKTEEEFRKKFVKDKKINSIMFFQAPRKVTTEEGWTVEGVERTFVFFHYFGLNSDEHSGNRTENYLENLINAFNSNETLNDSVKSHFKMDLVANTPATFGGSTLVHFAMLEMTTEETNDLS